MLTKFLFLLHRVLAHAMSHTSDRGSKPGNFLSPNESIDELLRSRKSLIRWGDGESTIVTGGDLYFQRNSLSLAWNLFAIVRKYKPESEYLLALPNEFLQCSRDGLVAKRKYRTWMRTRYIYSLIFHHEPRYLDSFIFREDSNIDNETIRKLWADEEVIAFVHNNYKYYTDFRENNTTKEVRFVGVFSANAYETRHVIRNEVMQIINEARTAGKSACVLMCAGPAGKILTAEMAEMGIRCLDMGHYFDYKFYGIRRDKKA